MQYSTPKSLVFKQTITMLIFLSITSCGIGPIPGGRGPGVCSHDATITCQSDQHYLFIRLKSIEESWKGTDQECEKSPYLGPITASNIDTGFCRIDNDGSSHAVNFSVASKTCKYSDSVIWTWNETKDKAYLTAPEYENKEVICTFKQEGVGSNY
jgi:hypothetical protein